jgi:DNA-binding MarR family transcriptional regulator/GNAT superfamily N-acetyltransferase
MGSEAERSGDVSAVRRFSRFYTRILGLLQEGLLDTPYSLTEARVLYELAQQDAVEVVELRRSIGVDGGYLSRLLTRLASDGVVERERSTVDGRRQVARLTERGREVFADLDRQSDHQVRDLLGALDTGQRHRLVGAMQTIESILAESARPEIVVLRAVGPGDLGWVVQRHGLLYDREYGWDESFEALVARVVADFVDQRERERPRVQAWIAEVDGQPVGCVFCMQKDARTAQLRLLLVEPDARGAGIGGRLVDECVRFARRSGYETVVLWTNDVLVDARRIYERAGFTLDQADPHHSFGKDLVGQYWSLRL